MTATRSQLVEWVVVDDAPDLDPEHGYPDPVICRASSTTNDHWLKVADAGVEWEGGDRWDWYLIHPSRCLGTYCAEAWLLDDVGPIDAFGTHPDAPEGLPLREGRWRVEFVHEVIHCGDFATEHDVYMRWIDDPFGAAS